MRKRIAAGRPAQGVRHHADLIATMGQLSNHVGGVGNASEVVAE